MYSLYYPSLNSHFNKAVKTSHNKVHQLIFLGILLILEVDRIRWFRRVWRYQRV